jgi:hypothetical protein
MLQSFRKLLWHAILVRDLGLTVVELPGIWVLFEMLGSCDGRWGCDAVLVAARDNLTHMGDVEEEGRNGGAQNEAMRWSVT